MILIHVEYETSLLLRTPWCKFIDCFEHYTNPINYRTRAPHDIIAVQLCMTANPLNRNDNNYHHILMTKVTTKHNVL